MQYFKDRQTRSQSRLTQEGEGVLSQATGVWLVSAPYPAAPAVLPVMGHRMRRIAIVGNAPNETDLSQDIDAADTVVRFNNAFGYGGVRGSKVDDLFLINCGGQPNEWLNSSEFWQRAYVVRTPKVTLPIPYDPNAMPLPIDHGCHHACLDGVNFEPDLRARLERMGKVVRVLPRNVYQTSRDILTDRSAVGSKVVPSTGFLSILDYLDRCQPDCAIELYGFAFAGWDGHVWSRERQWIERRHFTGELTWHQLTQSA